jgi:type IV pilus assembly protein PilE
MELNTHPQKGFTLLEVILVVAVIAILVTIAYPSYEEQIRRSRRADAQGALQAFAIAMERYKTEQLVPGYIGATAASSGAGPGTPVSTLFPPEAPLSGASKYYDLSVQSAAVSSYELRAAPKAVQSGDKCGTYTLKSTGQRGKTGGRADLRWQDCWK